MSLGTPGEGLQSNIAGKAIAWTLKNNNSRLSLQVKAFSGSEESIRLLGRGDIDVAASPNYLARSAYNSLNPIPNIDFTGDRQIEQEIVQSMTYMDLRQFFITLDENIQTTEDLRGATINVGPPGAAWFAMATFDIIGILDDIKIVNTGFKDIPFSLTEGRVDAAIASAALGVTPPPFLEPLRAKDVSIIRFTPGHLQKLREALGYRVSEIRVNDFFDKDFDFKLIQGATQNFQFILNGNTSNSLAYELAKVSLENKAEIQSFATFLQNFDGEYAISGLVEDIPVHPGVAAYYKDQGLWQDRLTVTGPDC